MFVFYINALWIQNSFCAGVPLCFCLYFEEYAYSVEESRNDVVCKDALHVLTELFHFVLENIFHIILELSAFCCRHGYVLHFVFGSPLSG